MVFLNDVYFCPRDIVRLLLHQNVSLACGLDLDLKSEQWEGLRPLDPWRQHLWCASRSDGIYGKTNCKMPSESSTMSACAAAAFA